MREDNKRPRVAVSDKTVLIITFNGPTAAAAMSVPLQKRLRAIFEERALLRFLMRFGPVLVLLLYYTPAHAQIRVGRANTIHELVQNLQACWHAPIQHARRGMEITVRLSFARSGAILGQPRITYETQDATEAERFAYRIALAEMLLRCTPAKLTDSLASSIAGRPITIRIKDQRRGLSPDHSI